MYILTSSLIWAGSFGSSHFESIFSSMSIISLKTVSSISFKYCSFSLSIVGFRSAIVVKNSRGWCLIVLFRMSLFEMICLNISNKSPKFFLKNFGSASAIALNSINASSKVLSSSASKALIGTRTIGSSSSKNNLAYFGWTTHKSCETAWSDESAIVKFSWASVTLNMSMRSESFSTSSLTIDLKASV